MPVVSVVRPTAGRLFHGAVEFSLKFPKNV